MEMKGKWMDDDDDDDDDVFKIYIYMTSPIATSKLINSFRVCMRV